MKIQNRPLLTAAILFGLTATAPGLSASDIVALCIGNDRYLKPSDFLDTPAADARLVAATLKQIPGVDPNDIVLVTDGTRETMSAALRSFKARSGRAKLAFIFYSGHGMEDTPIGESDPETFLLPVDADITGIDVLPERAISLSQVLKAMEGTRGARAVILDCCRTGAPSVNEVLRGASKHAGERIADAVKRALGAADVPKGTLVAFSAGPGRKAASYLIDEDINSPFTYFLVESMTRDGGDLLSIVNSATDTTKKRTGMRQIPHTEVRGDLSLIMGYKIPPIGPADPGSEPPSPVAPGALSFVRPPGAMPGNLAPTLLVHNGPSIPTLPAPAPVPAYGEGDSFLAVSYRGREGLSIRDSRDFSSPTNKHGDLMQQFESPLRQIGDLVWEDGREWVQVEVRGWVAIKNETKTFLQQQPDGRWKVVWNRRGDPLWMRTGTNSKTTRVCGLTYATHLEALDTDFTDPDYHYVFGRFAGWAVKQAASTVYMKHINPE